MSSSFSYHTADHVLDVLEQFAGRRKVLLLGSAPCTVNDFPDHDVLASVNASHSGYELRHVDILFLNSFSLKQPGAQDELRSRIFEHISYLSCNLLIQIDAASVMPSPPIAAKKTMTINREERNRLLELCLKENIGPSAGGSLVPSTGMQAALSLRHVGASIVFQGFSLNHGHLLQEGAKRQHLEFDERIFKTFGLIRGQSE